MRTGDIIPDKGYAWVTLAAAFGSNILQSDTFSTCGIFYEEYTERYEVSKALAAWISGLKMLMFAVGSFVCTFLLPRIGARWLVLLCTVVTISGYICTMFITNIYAVLFSYGIIPGLGLCTIATLWLQVTATFFKDYRGFAFGMLVGANAVGSTILPMLLQYMFTEYSWKGALLINAGMHLHNIAFGLILPSDFGKPTNSKTSKEIIPTRVRCDTFSGSTAFVNEKGNLELVQYSGSVSSLAFANAKKARSDVNHTCSVDNLKQISTFNNSEKTASKDGDETLHNSVNEKCEEAGKVDTEETNMRKLLENKNTLLHLIGTCFVKYGHISTYAFIPSLALEISLTKTQASAMVSMMAATNIVGRPVMGFLSDCGPCKSRKPWIYALVWMLYGIFEIILAWCDTFTAMLICVLLIGTCASYTVPVSASLLADIGGPKAVMLLPLTLSLGIFSGAVVGGLILELTGTCMWVMVTGGTVQMFGSLLLFINSRWLNA